MSDRTCLGCDTVITPGPRERNPKVWCSMSCRERTKRATGQRQDRPHYPRCHIWSRTCTECAEVFSARSSRASLCQTCIHGTANGYVAGCRCGDCRQAKAAQMRAYYRARGGNTARRPQISDDCLVCGHRVKHAPHTDAIHVACMPAAADQVSAWQEGPCRWCGERFTSNASQHRLYCTFKCGHDAGDHRRRARRVRAPGEFTWAELTRLWLNLGKRCAYCLHHVDAYEPDHVVPLSRGGSNSITNILPACRACNGQKHSKLLAEWQAWRAKQGLPPITSWLEEPASFAHLTVSLPTQSTAA